MKKGCAFTKAEEQQIIEYCQKNPHYMGNDAILLLMYTGMRVGELASMTYDDKYIRKDKERKKGSC